MKKTSYSQILDAVAGDHIANDVDLAPTIIARIQKGKGFRMQTKKRWVSAAVLVVAAFVVLFFTVPGVSAAIGRWFGYVPDVGLVSEGQIRVLTEPVSVTRDGVTVTVDQVVLNQESTTLVYSVDGIPNAAVSTQAQDQRCPYEVSLRLPDDSILLASPNGIDGWDAGYQHRFTYPAIPENINDATLVVRCLFNTIAEKAPENWEIPLHFSPAPPEFTAYPVIEIPTATVAPTDAAVEGTSTETAAESTISLTLDRAVQMEDGYLLYATLHWQDTPFLSVDVISPESTLHLLDENGQELLYEVYYDEQTGVQWDQRQTVFAIKTAPVQTTGALTMVLDSVLAMQPVQASFVFDPGSNPQPEQEWQPDVEITIGEYSLRVTNVIAHVNGYEISMTSDTGLLSASCTDYDHTVISGYGGGDVLGCGFNYEKELPDGPIMISIDQIGLQVVQPLQAQWTPPASSTVQLPTQPASCLNADAWKASLAQPSTIPDGLSGKVLVYAPVDKNNPNGEWQVAIVALDGSSSQPIEGARDGAFSPDGKKLVYAMMDGGIRIQDLESGEVTPIPGTGSGDFNPIWSPDGSQIVFNRGMGIFDLFIVNADGSDMRQLTSGGSQEFPAGWLPGETDLLYSTSERENETTVYRINVQTGESQIFFHEEIMAVSPDGQKVLSVERTFGDRFLVSIRNMDGPNRQLLNDTSLWLLDPTWSPDGQWLLASLSDTDAASTSGGLINLNTCEMISLPYIDGTILSWAP